MTTSSCKLDVKNACDMVINSARDSFLNYSLQETPYSIYLTIRKTFIRSNLTLDQNFCQVQLNTSCKQDDSEIRGLKVQVKHLEESNTALENKYIEAVDDCEQSYLKIKELETTIIELKDFANETEAYKRDFNKRNSEIQKKDKIIQQLKESKDDLEKEVETAEKSWKELNKSVRIKDKELHDLQKENRILTENLNKSKVDFSNLTHQVNNEKKSEAKKLKKAEKKQFIDSLNPKSVEFECDKCEIKIESRVKLKAHVRSTHETVNSTQTDVTELDDKSVQTLHSEFNQDKNIQTIEEEDVEIQKYPCFYCGINIVSRNHLNEHKRKCHGMSRMCGVLGLPAPIRFFQSLNPSRMLQPRFFY